MTETVLSAAELLFDGVLMEDLYSRTELLIGDKTEKLKSANIAVFGCGGVGSFAVEALARAGIGKITVVDADTVSPSNINRQLIATVDTVGRAKVDVQKERILSINPNCDVTVRNMFYCAETADDIDLSVFDYVCDAIDSVTSKLLLIEKCTTLGIPVISSMGTGNKLNPSLFEITDISKTSVCPLARVMRRELKARGINHLKVIYSKEKPHRAAPEGGGENGRRTVPASISFVPSCAGLMLAGEIICSVACIDR